ncbi:MAG: hypothetical protein ACI8SE_000288 [Bacteroidia bacterium]|jgi:hypothetical protein
MFKWLIFCLILCSGLTVSSQIKLHRSYFSNRGNVAKLAQQINGTAMSDSERVANVHFWITHHVKYDAKRYARGQTKNQETSDVLRRRKTLCSGYANLFQDLCVQSGVNAIVINGYSKNAMVDACDTAYLPDHAWNKVEIDQSWYNVDDTWDAGYIEYFKTSFLRRLGASITNGWIEPIKYKPHFIKQPQNQFFLSPENNFAVTHFPENSMLVGLDPSFTTDGFSEDSAFFYYENTLQSQQESVNNDFYQTYSSLDPIEQDKNDGENAQKVNDKNFYGITRYHYHQLFEQWEVYLDDPKTMKMDSSYLKSILTLSDSVLNSAHKNDSLIWEEYRDLSKKFRDKRHIQKAYNADYVRYLKRKWRHKSRQQRKIKNKKKRSKVRRCLSNKRYNRLLMRHFYKPGTWSKHPKREKADSLVNVFKTYYDSITQTRELINKLQQQLNTHLDSFKKAINDQSRYILKVGIHFESLTITRLQAPDDYDLLILSQKAEFLDYQVSDSTIQLESHYDAVYDLMDSIYRLGKNNYRYISRQRSVAKRVKRSTPSKMQYYALSDEFRRNLNKNKSADADIQKNFKRQLKRMRKATKVAAPVSIPLQKCNTEKRIFIPLDMHKNKRKKHSRDNKKLKRFAKRTKNKSSSRLEVLRTTKI